MKLKKRFISLILVVVMMATILPSTVFAAEDLHGFLGLALYGNVNVYQYMNLTTKIGTVYNGEGVTVLVEEANSYYIEYSTANGAKRGYVSKSLIYHEPLTCVGKMITASNVYYGIGSEYQQVGSVYKDEYVSVLASTGNYRYIEYNSASGRKRGYVPANTITLFNQPIMNVIYRGSDGSGGYSKTFTSPVVRAGTSNQYPIINAISGNITVTVLSDFYINSQRYYFIEYTAPGTTIKQSGYVW